MCVCACSHAASALPRPDPGRHPSGQVGTPAARSARPRSALQRLPPVQVSPTVGACAWGRVCVPPQQPGLVSGAPAPAQTWPAVRPVCASPADSRAAVAAAVVQRTGRDSLSPATGPKEAYVSDVISIAAPAWVFVWQRPESALAQWGPAALFPATGTLQHPYPFSLDPAYHCDTTTLTHLGYLRYLEYSKYSPPDT